MVDLAQRYSLQEGGKPPIVSKLPQMEELVAVFTKEELGISMSF
jgi:hypothetical protein